MSENKWDGLFECGFCKKRFDDEYRKNHTKQLWVGYNADLQRLDICKECQKVHSVKIAIVESCIEIVREAEEHSKKAQKVVNNLVGYMIDEKNHESEEQCQN